MTKKQGCITKERKSDIAHRLNRIKGQIKGIERMMEEGRYCLDILTQVASVLEALKGVSKVLMRNYLETCATQALLTGRRKKQKEIYDELMDIIYKFAR